MQSALKDFEALLKQGGTEYVAGNFLSIADLQYYFELTNMVVYEKPFS